MNNKHKKNDKLVKEHLNKSMEYLTGNTKAFDEFKEEENDFVEIKNNLKKKRVISSQKDYFVNNFTSDDEYKSNYEEDEINQTENKNNGNNNELSILDLKNNKIEEKEKNNINNDSNEDNMDSKNKNINNKKSVEDMELTYLTKL